MGIPINIQIEVPENVIGEILASLLPSLLPSLFQSILPQKTDNKQDASTQQSSFLDIITTKDCVPTVDIQLPDDVDLPVDECKNLLESHEGKEDNKPNVPEHFSSVEKGERLRVNTKLGEQLWLARSLRGMSQKDLADLSGISQGAISAIETNKTQFPRHETLFHINKALGQRKIRRTYCMVMAC